MVRNTRHTCCKYLISFSHLTSFVTHHYQLTIESQRVIVYTGDWGAKSTAKAKADDYIVRFSLYGKTIWLHDDMTYKKKSIDKAHKESDEDTTAKKKSCEQRRQEKIDSTPSAITKQNGVATHRGKEMWRDPVRYEVMK